jgi:DNA mismatch endonuclease (patch repair protein)
MKRKIANLLGRNLKKKRTSDKLTIKRRSSLMSKIRSKNTFFEKKVFLELKKVCAVAFQSNFSGIRGKPDIVFLKKKLCVFLDSDFWHGWQYPRWKHLLKNNFWRNKIAANRKRDIRNTQYLKRTGWKVLRFWEHELNRNLKGAVRKISNIAAEDKDK